MDHATAPYVSNGASAKGPATRIESSSDCDGEDTHTSDPLLCGDDDATVATAQHSLSGMEVTSERLAEWALAKVSSIDPTLTRLVNRTSRSSLFSDDDDGDDEADDSSDALSSAASFSSSLKGLENVSVATDVILPSRYSFHSYAPDQRQAHLSQEEYPSCDLEKFTTEQELDATSDTSASSAPSSSQSDRSMSEPVSEGDDHEDGTDDADSEMTIGDVASQTIDYTNKSDDDLESIASSWRLAPDEFWDWLDNGQVAFIEVDNNKLPRKPKTRVSTSAVPEKFADGLGERKEEVPCSEPPPSVSACYDLREECHDNDEDCRIASDHQHNEDIGCSAPKRGPMLKHNASVADFRSRAEQVQQAQQQVPCNVRRTFSYADRTAEPSPISHEPVDDCTTRMRRISSTEHRVLTLHPNTKKSGAHDISPLLGIHARLVTPHAQRGEFSEALVCYEPSRTRLTRRLVLLLPLLYILAFTLPKIPTKVYEAIAATWKPRTLTINLDSTLLPSYESVSVTFGTSAPAVVDVLEGKLPESLDDVNAILAESKLSAMELYNYLKDHLPSSPEIEKPRVVAIDVKSDSSVAYEEAFEFMGSSRAAMGDQRRTQSMDRLQSTLSRAHEVLVRHLSELCRSSTIEGPKKAVLGACDALYETLPNTYATAEGHADLRPPHLIFDKTFNPRSFDVMANETLEYIIRFATVIHDCQSIPLKAMSQGASGHVPHEAFMINDSSSSEKLSSERSPPIVLRLITQEGDSDRLVEPAPPNDSGSPVEHASTQDLPEESNTESEPPSQNKNSDNPDVACEGNGGVALSQRVRVILSHLDAKGRLDELESLVVEKFGPDVVGPPPSINLEAKNNLGWMPLLGKERDRHLHEHWLNSVEKLVLESMRQGPV